MRKLHGKAAWLGGLALMCSPVLAESGEAGGTPNPGGDTTLQQRINHLEAQNSALMQRLSAIEQQQGQTWLNERRSEEVKALVREVLADADTRVSLAGSGAVAGHDGKAFYLASEDGTFRLNIGGQIMMRYVYNNRDDAGSGEDDNEFGFEIRRLKLAFTGTVGLPKLEYFARLRADRKSGTVDAEIVGVAYALTDTIKITGGRMRDPFLREEMTNDTSLQIVERSLVNAVFTTDYVEGVMVNWNVCDQARLAVNINDGSRSGNVGTGSPSKGFADDATDFAVTARGDLKFAGKWEQKDDFEAWSNEDLGLFAGIAAHYELVESGASNSAAFRANTDSFIVWTVDSSVEYKGLSVYGAFIMEHTDAVDGVGAHSLDNHGFLVQAGYFIIPDKLEPYVRYEYLDIDDDAAPGGAAPVSIVTLGANYFLRKHASKFSLDVVWALDPLTAANTYNVSTNALNAMGLARDAEDQQNQVAIRAQFQLLF